VLRQRRGSDSHRALTCQNSKSNKVDVKFARQVWDSPTEIVHEIKPICTTDNATRVDMRVTALFFESDSQNASKHPPEYEIVGVTLVSRFPSGDSDLAVLALARSASLS
jgi:hypothetical protein